MTDDTVIAFPQRAAPSGAADGYRDWLSWAECEFSILGFALSASSYDWEAAYRKGLRPEVAAEQAAEGLDAD